MPDLEEPAMATHEKKAKKVAHHRDPTRETVETIVFVAVLVLLLKLFVTEAFVIPTGSMATTLYGIHKMITCPECGYEFPVNSHDEEEGNQNNGQRIPLHGYTCPNCRYQGTMQELVARLQRGRIPNDPGDRVLVLKPIYHVKDPQRGDVVVFKYPKEPQIKQTAQNYIKRAEGFGGETIALFRGDLYMTRSLVYPSDDSEHYPLPDNPLDIWEPKYMYSNAHGSNPMATELFEKSLAENFPRGSHGPFSGGFEIVRKGDRQLLEDRRPVWHNDLQPKLLKGKVPPRWYPAAEGETTWLADDKYQPKTFSHDGESLDWIRYRHLRMPWHTDPAFNGEPPTPLEELARQKPEAVDNFLGYNAGLNAPPAPSRESENDRKWVGDLILECEVDVGTGAEVVLELSKGFNRFQAKFGNGQVALAMTGKGSEDFKKPSRPCKVTTGKHRLRFANVDCKLWVWVDGSLVDFGTEGEYRPILATIENGASDVEGWVKENDVDAPASIGVKGKAIVAHLALDRDIYYTNMAPPLRPRTSPVDVYYVQPGCYLCLGDNSAQSSDSRTWGLVPNRLMLGKAVFVFWPYNRVGSIK